MAEHGSRRAVAEGESSHSYNELVGAIGSAEEFLNRHNVTSGQVVGLQADFSFMAITLALALFRRGCVVAFVSPMLEPAKPLSEARATALFKVLPDGKVRFETLPDHGTHALLDLLREEGRPGFVIFSSGSSGQPKAILHDLEQFLASYDRPMKPMATLAFLLFDHIAGIDTLFYTLHAGGGLVLVPDRSPQTVCQLVARWSVEVLPVSPSFLKLLCLTGIPDKCDLSSLQIITFGSEPMDPTTLGRVSSLFPHVKLRQKYGASEFGSPSAKTRDGDGLWIRLDSEHVKVRVVNDLLWLNAPTTMLGYLNADAPLMCDGWICTGDRVVVDGDWMRVLGRDSDIINVGGEKVFPGEVEAVINELDSVAEVAVAGAPHPLMGQMVTALIRPATQNADRAALLSAVRTHCMRRLARHKVPMRVTLTDERISNDRQKVVRTFAG